MNNREQRKCFYRFFKLAITTKSNENFNSRYHASTFIVKHFENKQLHINPF